MKLTRVLHDGPAELQAVTDAALAAFQAGLDYEDILWAAATARDKFVGPADFDLTRLEYTVECPSCGSAPGFPCTAVTSHWRPTSRPIKHPHSLRKAAP